MKIIFVFLVFCLAVVLAWPDEDEEDITERADAEEEIKASAFKDCWKKKKLTEEQMEDVKNWGCIIACMHAKIGYINADGSLNLERITQGNPDIREEIQKIYQTCVKYAKGDPCQLSLCLEEENFDKNVSYDDSSY